jgi:hypothetical protein
MKQWILFISLVFLFSSCEKAINFDLDPTTASLVVEATIENSQPPVVILSNSFEYFGNISPAILANSFVHNAVIKISNGATTHQLKEYSYNTPVNLKVYYYSIDSSNLATAFTGVFNKTYSMEIQADGKTYTAVTTIPLLTKKIDSLWWKKAPDNPDTNKVVLVGKATDPPGLGNYIRYFTKANSENFYPGLNSVFDDQIIDGKTYTLDIERGVDRNQKLDMENYSFFKRGDTITINSAILIKLLLIFGEPWNTVTAASVTLFHLPQKCRII